MAAQSERRVRRHKCRAAGWTVRGCEGHDKVRAKASAVGRRGSLDSVSGARDCAYEHRRVRCRRQNEVSNFALVCALYDVGSMPHVVQPFPQNWEQLAGALANKDYEAGRGLKQGNRATDCTKIGQTQRCALRVLKQTSRTRCLLRFWRLFVRSSAAPTMQNSYVAWLRPTEASAKDEG